MVDTQRANNEINALGTGGDAEQKTEIEIENSSDTEELEVNITPASAACNECFTSTSIKSDLGTTDTVNNAAEHDESPTSQFCDAESAAEMKIATFGSKVEKVRSNEAAQEESLMKHMMEEVVTNMETNMMNYVYD